MNPPSTQAAPPPVVEAEPPSPPEPCLNRAFRFYFSIISTPTKQFFAHILTLVLYILSGFVIYIVGLTFHSNSSNAACSVPDGSTHTGYCGTISKSVADGFYFSVVSIWRIGYGDIVPALPVTKALACIYILGAALLLEVFLTAPILHQTQLWYGFLLRRWFPNWGWGTGFWGRCVVSVLAFFAAVLVYVVVLHSHEGMGWGDALYSAIVSASTAGYGDKAFQSWGGRIFATVWLPVTTFSLANIIYVLAEGWMKIKLNWMLVCLTEEKIGAMVAADNMALDAGHIRGMDVVLLMLKDMGRLDDDEMSDIRARVVGLEDSEGRVGWISVANGNVNDNGDGNV